MRIPRRLGTLLTHVLKVFGDVRREEVPGVLLLSLNSFVLLTTYYLLKVAREPLILFVGGGAELKSYATGAQALLLVLVVRANDWLAARLSRMALLATIALSAAAILAGFFVLSLLHVPIGIAFYLFVGIFSVTLIAQFWSLANDIYTAEQGTRLFAVIGIGGVVGSVAGSAIAGRLIVVLGPSLMMLVAALMVVVYVGLMFQVHQSAAQPDSGHHHTEAHEQPLSNKSGFALLLEDRYLLLIGSLVLILNCVNTIGEYLLDRSLLLAAPHLVAHATDPEAIHRFVGAYKAKYFFAVNSCSLGLQLFVASRAMKILGVRGALFLLPLVDVVAYAAILVVPILSVVLVSKVVENSLNYSIQNTTRQALFLVTSREAKYKVKTVIDSFLQRAGDVVSAGIVWAGAWLHLSIRELVALVMIGLAGWLTVVVAIGKQHRERERQLAASSGTPASAATG
jgi:ATP:ADP antiporter, AAA family